MANIKVSTFAEAHRQLVHIVGRKNNRFFLDLWNNVVDATPVLTGTARYSWILTAGRPSTIKPPVKQYSRPSEPAVEKYTYRWINWYITNNQVYVPLLNNGSIPTNKAAPGWIDAAVKKSVNKFNAGSF